MSDSAFERLADSLIDTLEGGLGDDVERQDGVLTLEAVEGTWVINKHAPTRQIWVSSPKSGARHYAFDETTRLWKDTRGGPDLLTAINAELGVTLDWRPE